MNHIKKKYKNQCEFIVDLLSIFIYNRKPKSDKEGSQNV